MFTKYATAEILCFAEHSPGIKIAGKRKLGSFEYEPRNDGHKYLYVAVRACTADVPNLNMDMLPDSELGGLEKYKTFEGAYVYLNHDNMDSEKARGAVIAAKYHDEDPDEDGNKWVEVLEELDEEKCPKLCALIRSGEIDTVSMGCSVENTTCSVCGNVAEFPGDYCEHIQQKGRYYGDKLAYEICNGIDFFELSWVYTPADPTAHVQALQKEAKADRGTIGKTASELDSAIDAINKEMLEATRGFGLSFPMHEEDAWSIYETLNYDDVEDPFLNVGCCEWNGWLYQIASELGVQQDELIAMCIDRLRSSNKISSIGVAKVARINKAAYRYEWYEYDQDEFSFAPTDDSFMDDPDAFGGIVMQEDGQWLAYCLQGEMSWGDRYFNSKEEAVSYIEDMARQEGHEASVVEAYPDSMMDEALDEAERRLDERGYDRDNLQQRAMSTIMQLKTELNMTRDQAERLRKELLVKKWAKAASIGFVEKMNNGRYCLMCGTMEQPDLYYYGSGDTQEDCVAALAKTPEDLGVEVDPSYTPCEGVLILENCFFGERKRDIQSCTKEVIMGRTAQSYGGYELVDKKQVEDSDGFYTDYALYENTNNGGFVTVFGDMDVYSPEDGYFDMEFDTYDEAMEWFESYGGKTAADRSMRNFADAPREPDEISTQEDSKACPLCGTLTYDGEYCDVCGYQEPPEGFGDIELEDEESYEEYEREAEGEGDGEHGEVDPDILDNGDTYWVANLKNNRIGFLG